MGGTIGGMVDSFTDTMFGGSQQESSSGVPRWARDAWLENREQALETAEGLDPRQIAGLGLDFTRGANVMRQQTGAGSPGMQTMQQGINAAQGAVGDAPQVQGFSAGALPSMQGFDAPQGQAAQLDPSNIQRYQNPHTDQVVDAAMSDLDRQRQRQTLGIGDQAAAAGAFGGSRHGVAEAETNRAFADQMAQTAAGLRQGGFDQAAGLASQDVDRRQQTGMADLQSQLQAAQSGMQAQQGNLQAALQAAESGMTADQSNQQAALQQMGLGLNQAGMLGGLGQQMQQMGMQGAQGLLGLDEMQRGVEQEQLDAQYEVPLLQQQIRNQALGLGAAGGATQSQQQGRSSPGLLGGLGQVFGS